MRKTALPAVVSFGADDKDGKKAPQVMTQMREYFKFSKSLF
jgi:hypothetical protein